MQQRDLTPEEIRRRRIELGLPPEIPAETPQAAPSPSFAEFLTQLKRHVPEALIPTGFRNLVPPFQEAQRRFAPVAARGLELGLRPVEVLGELIGSAVDPIPKYDLPTLSQDPSMRERLGGLVSQFEQREPGLQNLLTLPFMGLPEFGAAGRAAAGAVARPGAKAAQGYVSRAVEAGATTAGIPAPRRVTMARKVGAAGKRVTQSIAKEPWQMTRYEWSNAKQDIRLPGTGASRPRLGKQDIDQRAAALEWFNYGVEGELGLTGRSAVDHKQIISKALSEGKPVPPEVLADYPDLAGQVAPSPAPAPAAAARAAEAVAPRVTTPSAAGGGLPPPLRGGPPEKGGVPPTATGGMPPGGQAPTQGTAIDLQSTLVQAKAIVERDRPGLLTRLTAHIPGVKALHPSLDLPEHVTASWVGQGLAQTQVQRSLYTDVHGAIANLDSAFGKGAASTRDFKPTGVKFLGSSAERAANATGDYTGTLADILERPSLYDLSPTQRQTIESIQQAKSIGFDRTKTGFGLDIEAYPVQPGGVHVPHVDISEDAIAVSGSIANALRTGRAKERLYPTLADRLHNNPSFHPETKVSNLLFADARALGEMSGRRVFMEGVGGKTKLQVMEELHPALAAKMDALQAKLNSVKSAAARLGSKQGDVIDDFLASPLDDADLATLQADLNPTVGANAVGKQGVNYGKDLRTLRAEVASAKANVVSLRPAWRVANLTPYTRVQEAGNLLFVAKEASQIRTLLKTSSNPLVSFADNLRGTRFGGDFSPISIQGVNAFLADPVTVVRAVAQGKTRVSLDKLLADMRTDPTGWDRFTGATGINPLGNVGEEFTGGFLSKVPKLGPKWEALNEALFRPIVRLQKEAFGDLYQAGLKSGLSEQQAAAIAADDVMKWIPRYNFRRLGQSTAQAAASRAVVTSVSFITQPAALMADAAKGMAKLGTVQTVSPSERYAMKRVLTLLLITESVAVLSAASYAKSHKQNVNQAILDALNPDSGNFMALRLPWGARVGLGGPIRSLIRAIAPHKMKVVGVDDPIYVPFGRLYTWARSKLGPLGSTVWGEITNEDYFHKKIRTGAFPVNILQSLEYAAEQSLPMASGAIAEQLRHGTPEGIPEAAASQLVGTNYQPFEPVYDAKLRWAKDMAPYGKISAAEDTYKAAQTAEKARVDYRKNNPEVDAKLFITGRVTSLQTVEARLAALRLMRENKIKMSDVKAFAQSPSLDSPPAADLRLWFQQALGEGKPTAGRPTPRPTGMRTLPTVPPRGVDSFSQFLQRSGVP